MKLKTSQEKRVLLRKYLAEKRLVRAPVLVDVLSALLIEKSGFEAIAIGGYPTSGSLLGLPDIGLLTMTEVVDTCRRIANVTSVPLIVDGDNGYGGVPNVVRTVRELENAGATAIVLEDQQWPKRCGHMSGKTIVPVEEFIAKIRAAVKTRVDQNLAIVARTDARAVVSLEEAVSRANAALLAGADVAFIEAPASLEELRLIPSLVRGPVFVNMLDGGKTPLLTHSELQSLGYSIVVHPTALLFNYVKHCKELLKSLYSSGSTSRHAGEMVSFEQYVDLVGLSEQREIEAECLQWSQGEAVLLTKVR